MNDLAIFNIDEVCSKLAEHNFKFSQSTIYNTIRLLNIKPYKVEILPNRRRRYYYDNSCLQLLQNELGKRIKLKEYRRLNMAECYVCHRFVKTLTSGLCISCHAKKFARNYTNKGTMFDYIYDIERAEALFSAISAILQANKH